MATNDFLAKAGTPVILGLSGSHSPIAAANFGTPGVALTLSSVANNAYQQSAKVDFGVAWNTEYEIIAALEFAATPTAGALCTLFYAPSNSGTAGTANVAGTSGADAAYTGYSSNAVTAIRHALIAGVHICTVQATANVQVSRLGILRPLTRYANFVFHNNSGAAMHSDMVEMSIAFLPIIYHPAA